MGKQKTEIVDRLQLPLRQADEQLEPAFSQSLVGGGDQVEFVDTQIIKDDMGFLLR